MDEFSNQPMYSGRPTAYVDQNVLTMVVKNRNPGFFRSLSEEYQVIYSDDTLREIKRSGQPDKFLTALIDLNAMHFKYQLDEAFEATGNMIIGSLSPTQAFANYLLIEPVYDTMFAAAHQTTLKIYGGKTDASFTDIADEQASAFQGLIGLISSQLHQIDNSREDLRGPIEQYLKSLQSQYEIAVAVSSAEMTKHINDEKGESGVQNYRASVGMGPVQLNNVEPPRVIEKIWDIYQHLDDYRGKGFSIENFLGISNSPIYNREMHLHEKVTAIYNLLNFIGYKPDSRLYKEQRHVASISDAAHASIASHAHVLLSGDHAFVNKVRAIYEFLNVQTDVGLVTEDGERISVRY
ncbi:hypothetical protein [Pseudomonas fluorescens]|uniref:hypothetical protein n=1 Tax=Pseudomonas fluorescens TaxID=294 RepID=UPI001CD1E1FE|nr:hypothetical protein [Pseudomonas fluorescens]